LVSIVVLMLFCVHVDTHANVVMHVVAAQDESVGVGELGAARLEIGVVGVLVVSEGDLVVLDYRVVGAAQPR
jgi:hypothetical protein